MLALRSATAAADEAAAAGEAGGQSGLYAKYQRAEEEARAAREEQAATEATLSQVLLEIDGKVPRILAQQQALHALRDEHEETSAKLAAAMHAGEAASERAAALQRMLDARDAQVKSLDLEVGDLSQQLQTVLFEQQRKAAVGGATPRATLSIGSAWLAAAPAVGSPGFGLSPAATPARGNARGGGGAADTPAGVITAHLISFSDVAQLQGQNAQLLRTLRALGDEHEAALREKEQLTDQVRAPLRGLRAHTHTHTHTHTHRERERERERERGTPRTHARACTHTHTRTHTRARTDTHTHARAHRHTHAHTTWHPWSQAVAAALGEVSSLREASEAQKLQVEQLVQQRDMYKELGGGGGGGGGGAGALTTFAGGATAAAATAATAAAEAEVEGLKAELARVRQEYGDSQEQQGAQTERARAAEHDARVKQAQGEAELAVLHARLNALSAAEASGGESAQAARRAEVAISSQLLEAQATLKARNEELLAAQADGRRHAAAAELSRQEKGVLSEAQARLAHAARAATPWDAACNPMPPATPCTRGCNPMCPGRSPHVPCA
jgi:hypothetical protein